MGLETSLIWTANIAAMRTVITARGVEGADGEARVFAEMLLAQVKEYAPQWFACFVVEPASDYGMTVVRR